MISSGTIGMPLHFGKVPGFLTERMGKMGDAIVEHCVQATAAGEAAIVGSTRSSAWSEVNDGIGAAYLCKSV